MILGIGTPSGRPTAFRLQVGAHAGRLVIPADHRLVGDTEGISWSHIIYSDDHGTTWHLGGGLDQTQEVNNDSNEAAVIELPDGSLYMTIRVNNNEPTRGGVVQLRRRRHLDDFGPMCPTLTSARVSGSLLRLDATTILYAGPDTLPESESTSDDDLDQLRQCANLGQEQGRVLRIRRLFRHGVGRQ